MSSGIYEIRNIKNNKVYVGSSNNLSSRWNKHLNSLKKGGHHSRHLQRAWDKYEETSFRFSILEHVEGKENLLLREQYWMDLLKCKTDGYNCVAFASSTRGGSGIKLSEERKTQIGKDSKAAWDNPARKLETSQRMKGNTNTLGFTHSEESKAKMSAHHKGLKRSDESKENYRTAAIIREHEKRLRAIPHIEPEWLTSWKAKNV